LFQLANASADAPAVGVTFMRPFGRILRTADFLPLRGWARMRLLARCTCRGRHFSCFAKKSNQKKATPAAQVIALAR